jgi:hypothetical protein
MEGYRQSDSPQEINNHSYNRRSLIKNLTAAAAIPVISTTETSTAQARPNDPLDDFNPIWTETRESHWSKQEDDESGAISIRKALFLNDFSSEWNGQDESMFEFGLAAFGFAGTPTSSGQPAPSNAFHSNHTIRAESDSLNMYELTATQPRIGAVDCGPFDLFKELPDDEDKPYVYDIEEAEITAPDTSTLTGGLGTLLGVGGLAAAPFSGGLSLLLSGGSVGFSIASLTDMGQDQGISPDQTEDEWIYNLKQTQSSVIGATSRKDISTFMHSIKFRMSVEHDASGAITFSDQVESNGDEAGGRDECDSLVDDRWDNADEWIDNNKKHEWRVVFPEGKAEYGNLPRMTSGGGGSVCRGDICITGEDPEQGSLVDLFW